LDDKPPLKGRGQGHMTHFTFRRLLSYLRNGLSDNRQILYAGEMYQVLAFGWHDTTP